MLDAVAHLVPICQGNEIIVTHGNGPQIGMLAIESGNDTALSQPFPLDVLGAQTQGMIGYWLAQALGNALERRVVAILTRTIVNAGDPAFETPTKFVGRGYSPEEARRVGGGRWVVQLDGALWRRVVPSPEPLEVVEIATITDLVAEGTIVVCAGGGGIPVRRTQAGHLEGVEAVIDKDLAAALIARDVHADALLLLTDVPAVFVDYGQVTQQPLGHVTVEELRAQKFAVGSMAPKVEAGCRFVASTGHHCSIGNFDDAPALLRGTAGTTIFP